MPGNLSDRWISCKAEGRLARLGRMDGIAMTDDAFGPLAPVRLADG